MTLDKQKKTRKREKTPLAWAVSSRKIAKQCGKAYIRRDGVEVACKSPVKDDVLRRQKCRLKCRVKICFTGRETLLRSF